MKMRKVIIVMAIMSILMSGILFGEKVATLEEVMKPQDLMVVNEGRLYVIEGTTVFIYSLSDYKLIKKFGKKGEGPQEFKTPPYIIPLKDRLLLNTQGKMSYYTKDGEFISEKKVGSVLNYLMRPHKDGFIGMGVEVDGETVYRTISFYDQDFKKIKKLCRLKLGKRGGKQKIPGDTVFYQVLKDRIAVIYSSDFTFDILDQDGNVIKTVKKDHKRRPFTEDDEKKVHEILKLQFGARYEAGKNFIQLPKDYWPAIMAFLTDGEKLYTPTWHIKESKILFFIFDAEGKEVKNLYIPFTFRNAFQPFPFAIDNGKLYQLIENEDEEWELHISKID